MMYVLCKCFPSLSTHRLSQLKGIHSVTSRHLLYKSLQTPPTATTSRHLAYYRSLRKVFTDKCVRRFRKSFSSLLLFVPATFSFRLLSPKQANCLESKGRDGELACSSYHPKFNWQRFWELVKPYSAFLVVAIFSSLAAAFLNILIPLHLGKLINGIQELLQTNKERNFLNAVKPEAVNIALLYVMQGIVTFTYIWALSCAGERAASCLRQELFLSLSIQEISFYDEHRTGAIVNRLTTDVQDFKSSFKQCVSQGLRSITQIAGCFVSLYAISPQMTGIMVAVLPSIVIVGYMLGSSLRKLSQEAQAQVAVATEIADEALGNIRTVRAFSMEEQARDCYSIQLEKSRIYNERLGIGIALFQGLSNMALNGIVLGTLCIGGYLITSGNLGGGDLMAFLVATQTIQRSLAQFSLLYGHFMRGVSAGARVFEYLEREPLIPLKGGHIIPLHLLNGNVEFADVSFSYPIRNEQIVLDHFNLEIPKGKVVALVGPSGNGKSTVAALLERFYEVDSGSITLDGIDLRSLDPTWLRKQVIGYINQEPVLFAATVMENIRYGRPGASDEEVMEAARKANADSFINQFPHGYQTLVGERGVTVSGGQKQRLAIARALLKDPQILLLDEATSALDAVAEREVQAALDSAMKDRTTLIIAHRLSTIKNADYIAVVIKGKVVEIGTHEELKKKGRHYWNLIRQQDEAKIGA